MSQRIRVLYCIDNMRLGGTELNAVRTAARLDRSRFDVSALSLGTEGPLVQHYADAGIPVSYFPIANLYGPRAIGRGMQLARFLVAQRIEIVHSHDMYNNIFATLWARVARTPVVIASRRWWHSLPERRYRIGNAVGFRLADCVLANSVSVAQALQHVERVRAHRIAVIPNFVDDSAFAAIPENRRSAMLLELGVPAGAVVVGIVARLTPVKDHATLLSAVSQLTSRWPQLHVVLFGEGECRAQLDVLARRLGIVERIHFGGTRPNEPNLHALFDVSVLCSISEGFPNSIVEAMAAGRAVVATNVGGNADALQHGVTGMLVPPRQPDVLAGALEPLLADVGLRGRMGGAAQRRAFEEYHVSRVVPMLEGLYERLLRREVAPEARVA